MSHIQLLICVALLGGGIAGLIYNRWKFNRDTRALVRKVMAEHRATYDWCQHCHGGKLLELKEGRFTATDCPHCAGKGTIKKPTENRTQS